MAVWSTLFHPLQVSVDDDFFLDLGGHSLLVARMVSELRKDAAFASLAVTDVYKHPTIAQLAAAIDAANTSQEATAAQDKRAADAKVGRAAPETDDSPKRQGDKLEQARDAAAGKLGKG